MDEIYIYIYLYCYYRYICIYFNITYVFKIMNAHQYL